MTRLLYIKASPRGAESRSNAVADAYLSGLKAKIPGLEVDVIDLAQEKLPEFDGDKNAAKMAIITGSALSQPMAAAWDVLSGLARRFISADRYLLAVPMWNGGIPYKLKQYIDLIHQPGLLFGFDPATGYIGLLKDKKAVLALTSGVFSAGAPSPSFGSDHHSTYLRTWLNQAGVTDITELRFQPTLLTADPESGLQSAINAAQAAARTAA